MKAWCGVLSVCVQCVRGCLCVQRGAGVHVVCLSVVFFGHNRKACCVVWPCLCVFGMFCVSVCVLNVLCVVWACSRCMRRGVCTVSGACARCVRRVCGVRGVCGVCTCVHGEWCVCTVCEACVCAACGVCHCVQVCVGETLAVCVCVCCVCVWFG